MRYAERLLSGTEEERIARHIADCRHCREQKDAMTSFAGRLDQHWLDARLAEMHRGAMECPSLHELTSHVLGESVEGEAERLARHTNGCAQCRAVLAEIEAHSASLIRADPLAAAAPPKSRRQRLTAFFDLLPAPACAVLALVAGLGAGLFLHPAIIDRRVETPGGAFRISKPLPPPAVKRETLGIAPSVNAEAEALFRDVMSFYGDPDFASRAIPKLRAAVAAAPLFDQAWFWLGVAYLLREEPATAIPLLEKAAELAPGSREYKQYLVWAYLKGGSLDKALAVQTEMVNSR